MDSRVSKSVHHRQIYDNRRQRPLIVWSKFAVDLGLQRIILQLRSFPVPSEDFIAFASRTLSSSERIYAQIDKKAVAKVSHLLIHYIPHPDHQPLKNIWGPNRRIPPIATMRGYQVIIPQVLRHHDLQELHDCHIGANIILNYPVSDLILQRHIGATKMKGIARNHLWRPVIDIAIYTQVKSCEPYITSRSSSPVQHYPWIYPKGPWERISPGP